MEKVIKDLETAAGAAAQLVASGASALGMVGKVVDHISAPETLGRVAAAGAAAVLNCMSTEILSASSAPASPPICGAVCPSGPYAGSVCDRAPHGRDVKHRAPPKRA